MDRKLVNDLFELLESNQREQALDIILSNSLNTELHKHITSEHILSLFSSSSTLLSSSTTKNVKVLTNFSSVPSLCTNFEEKIFKLMLSQISTYSIILRNISALTESEALFLEYLETFLSSPEHLPILINLSRFPQVRAFLFEHQTELQVFYTQNDFVLLLLNLLFDVEKHDEMPLISIIEFVTSLLYRMIDLETTQFSKEEKSIFGFIEGLPAVDCSHPLECIQCLLLVGTTLQGRNQLRSVKSLYPTLREFHKQCDGDELKVEIENLAGYLIRDEEEPLSPSPKN